VNIVLHKNVIGNLEIYNMIGERKYSSPISGEIISLDISSLEQGIYFLRITSGRDQTRSRLVVIR
jgi:hypothetical protein